MHLTRRKLMGGFGASSMLGLITPSRASPSGFVAWHDRDLASHQASYDAQVRNGLGLLSFALYGAPPSGILCAAVMAPRSDAAAEKLVLPVLPSALDALVAAMAKEGLGPAIVTAVGPDAKATLGVVFRQMAGTSACLLDLTEHDLIKQCNEQRKLGRTLTSLDSYGDVTTPRFIAAWSDNPLAPGWRLGQPADNTSIAAEIAAYEQAPVNLAQLTIGPPEKISHCS